MSFGRNCNEEQWEGLQDTCEVGLSQRERERRRRSRGKTILRPVDPSVGRLETDESSPPILLCCIHPLSYPSIHPPPHPPIHLQGRLKGWQDPTERQCIRGRVRVRESSVCVSLCARLVLSVEPPTWGAETEPTEGWKCSGFAAPASAPWTRRSSVRSGYWTTPRSPAAFR